MQILSRLILVTVCIAINPQAIAQSDREIVRSLEIEEALAKPKTRGIRVQVKANVDLHIPFEINSSTLKPQAVDQLEQLESALKKDSLANYRFEVAGHTDASGAAEYNRQLSWRRAESVKRFLVDRGIDGDRLETVGHGEEELLIPDKPLHPDNRRVEIRNLGESR
ncbi:MAG: OmpA family protein [Gammaproteobacteria bacterium]|nr:OmpA family protein [Gammaproteobacteria bacterium]